MRKIIGVILLGVGLLIAVLMFKGLFGSDKVAKLKDAVYVGQADEINPENDGKVVIVTGELQITEPAHDDVTGVSFDSLRAWRTSGKVGYSTTEKEKNKDWSWIFTEVQTYNGKGKIGNYILSDEYIDSLMASGGTYQDYDKDMLAQLGYAFYEFKKESQGYYIMPIEQIERGVALEDVRHKYSIVDYQSGDVVTTVGVQEGNTLKLLPGISKKLMNGEVTKEEFIKKNRKSNTVKLLFGLLFGVIFIVVGGNLLFRKEF